MRYNAKTQSGSNERIFVMNKRIVNVSGAVIRRGSKILICGRASGTKLAGYKEFPGGKADAGETLSECLKREIRDELGSEIDTLDILYQTQVELPDRIYHLHFIRAVIRPDSPEPQPRENQEMEWLETADIGKVNMLPAEINYASRLAEAAGNR